VRLSDTCPCGSRFEVRAIAASVAEAWSEWMAAHEQCRVLRQRERERRAATGARRA
jgi:hypothetical protein